MAYQPGRNIDSITVEALLRPEALATLSSSGHGFCASASCPIVYFADSEAFDVDAVAVPVFQKEAGVDRTVCYCFQIGEADLRREIQAAGGSTASKRVSAHVKAGRCACEIKNPQGQLLSWKPHLDGGGTRRGIRAPYPNRACSPLVESRSACLQACPPHERESQDWSSETTSTNDCPKRSGARPPSRWSFDRDQGPRTQTTASPAPDRLLRRRSLLCATAVLAAIALTPLVTSTVCFATGFAFHVGHVVRSSINAGKHRRRQ